MNNNKTFLLSSKSLLLWMNNNKTFLLSSKSSY